MNIRVLLCCLVLLSSLRAYGAEAATTAADNQDGSRSRAGVAAGDTATVIRLRVEPEKRIARIPAGFVGFGYEKSIVAVADYFSPKNATLLRLYRNLGSDGLIRIGGNVSDHTAYARDGAAVANAETKETVINEAGLKDLAAFARAAGWKIMWGLNLGTGSKAAAADEAVAVHRHLGSTLESLEIGNEVDLRSRYTTAYRDYAGYHSLYLEFKQAVRGAWPEAVFSGPDVAHDLQWLRAFAQTESGDMDLLTYHYYRTGARKPEATMANLLRADDGWAARLAQLQEISQSSGRGYRINEINSFSGGGKPGISDTFASALWCLDNMFLLASHGCNGVNMETDINQLGWISHYSPIVRDAEMRCRAKPEYYGMLAFALAGKGELLNVRRESGEADVTAYATRPDAGSLWVVVINKDLAKDVRVELAAPAGYASAEAFRLTAPSVDSTDRVTLAGAEVSADGTWSPRAGEKPVMAHGAGELTVRHASAVLLHLEH